MKILIVNWTWHNSGGDWTYIDSLRKLYQEKGIETLEFSTQHPKNIPSKYSKYFVGFNDYTNLNKKKTIGSSINVVKSSIYNKEAIVNLERLIQDNPGITIAHLHNIHHHITPSIIPLLKRNGIKVIWSLHDYKILCPHSRFVSNEKICENCKGGRFFNCTLQKCKKGSLSGSLLASMDAYYYKAVKMYEKVDAFLCPSEFIANKFIEYGHDRKKIFVSNLCYDIPHLDQEISLRNNLDQSGRKRQKPYCLFVGRIEQVKGIESLLEAFKNSDINLKIAGGGNDERLNKLVKDASHNTNIENLGFKNKEEIYSLTLDSEFVVIPSVWYENFPFSIIESLLMRKPVIGANIGGIPELVVHEKTGLLFKSGDHIDMYEKAKRLWENKTLALELGQAARQHAERKVSYASHWEKLSLIFDYLN